MHDFIQLFTETTPPSIAQIKVLRQNNSWREIADILHKIKPTVELFGMMHIHNEIKLAEHAGKTGQDLDKMDGWLDHILSNLEESIEALSKEIPKYA
ncbi:MAG: hypothetical protein ACYC1Q_01390 [Bacteroidia bacterium]